MRNLKVSIVGNSVGLRIRPPESYPNNKNYGMLLEEMLQEKYPDTMVLVNNLCIGRATLWDVLEKSGDILNTFPNYYIVNLGVTDASTREIPLWFSDIINRDRPSLFKKVLRGLYIYIIRKVRPQLVFLRGKTTWTSKKSFKNYFDKFIGFLNKESNARIIIISINNATRRIEDQLPGSTKNYIEYNEIIKTIADKHKAYYINSSDIQHEIHSPDGIHLSLEGHKIFANRIFEVIEKEEALNFE